MFYVGLDLGQHEQDFSALAVVGLAEQKFAWMPRSASRIERCGI